MRGQLCKPSPAEYDSKSDYGASYQPLACCEAPSTNYAAAHTGYTLNHSTISQLYFIYSIGIVTAKKIDLFNISFAELEHRRKLSNILLILCVHVLRMKW